MLKKILIGLAVLILGPVVLVALQPSDFRVERSATLRSTTAHHNFMEKVFCKGDDMERGLGQMKSVLETGKSAS
jgi:hypothetical protein